MTFGLNNNIQWQCTSDFFIWQNADSGAYLQMPNTAAPSHAFRFHSDPWISYFDAHNIHHSLRMRYYKVRNQFANNQDKNNGSELYYGQYLFQTGIVNNLLNAENMGRPGDFRPPRTIMLQFRYDL